MACVELFTSPFQASDNSSERKGGCSAEHVASAAHLRARSTFAFSLPCSISTGNTNIYKSIIYSRHTTCALCVAINGGARFHFACGPALCCRPASFVTCSPSTTAYDLDSDSDSDPDPGSAPEQADDLLDLAEQMLSDEEEASSTPLSV